MSVSLYDVSVGSYLQILGSVAGFLEKARAHAAGAGENPDGLVEARIHGDMFPLAFQIASVVHHSIGAIEAVKAGVAGPPGASPGPDFAALQKAVADATAAVKALTPDEVNALAGRDVNFKLGEMVIPFTAEGYLLSFSLPNFYFHATTAYDILRMKGVPLGKRDFLGGMKIKR